MFYSLLFRFLISGIAFNTPQHIHSNTSPGKVVRLSRTFERIPGKNEYTVNVHIQVNGISGFGRLTEFFPPGVKVNILEGAASSSRVENDKLRCIWVSLPDSPEITVSYTIAFPDDKLIMYYRGEFSCIVNNEAKTTKMKPEDLKLIGE